ncbi:hypothetical protein BDN71DRAFT_1430954 [Pleurotus eryngii]|uniref:Uncharacterized protein n=1 Tax=Pleurotus eryngii TaxID=5323 RepID=A0A9P5ZW36_PLEER|nr:hypothetical protein BDN71DRAFT_1430954 [Pleurotus eryngii]
MHSVYFQCRELASNRHVMNLLQTLSRPVTMTDTESSGREPTSNAQEVWPMQQHNCVFVSKRNSEWHFEVCIMEVRYEPYAEMTEEGRRDDGGDQEEQDHNITKNSTDSDAQSNIDDSEMTDDEESDDSEGPDDREEASSEEVTEYWGTNVEGTGDGTATYEEPASGNEEEPFTGYNETIEKARDEEGGSLDTYEERRARGNNATIRDATSENYSERPELWQFSNIGGEFGGCYSKTWSFAN